MILSDTKVIAVRLFEKLTSKTCKTGRHLPSPLCILQQLQKVHVLDSTLDPIC